MKRIIDLQYNINSKQMNNQIMKTLFLPYGYIPHYENANTLIIMDVNHNVVTFDLKTKEFYWNKDPRFKYYIDDYWNVEYDKSEMTEDTVKMLHSTYEKK